MGKLSCGWEGGGLCVPQPGWIRGRLLVELLCEFCSGRIKLCPGGRAPADSGVVLVLPGLGDKPDTLWGGRGSQPHSPPRSVDRLLGFDVSPSAAVGSEDGTLHSAVRTLPPTRSPGLCSSLTHGTRS
ncbi:hepatoma-derived growth factor-related protein 3-like [Platysternon megacephalum]|uniref:Hepatoma-derived growth factor-related protein 3-like n=1 Tax=Platysternon megacephalum TaxID=55544 RepID=A0A4D9ES48_9SAUR|nr:hepatoma-derived growth factor-related protein 3-like [Platysternon megacephalum]